VIRGAFVIIAMEMEVMMLICYNDVGSRENFGLLALPQLHRKVI
jgi:hypothetical protein